MFKAIWHWFKNFTKRSTYNRWVFIRDREFWTFVHPWERRFVDERLKQGWENWTEEDTRELVELIRELGKRMIDSGSGLGAP